MTVLHLGLKVLHPGHRVLPARRDSTFNLKGEDSLVGLCSAGAFVEELGAATIGSAAKQELMMH